MEFVLTYFLLFCSNNWSPSPAESLKENFEPDLPPPPLTPLSSCGMRDEPLTPLTVINLTEKKLTGSWSILWKKLYSKCNLSKSKFEGKFVIHTDYRRPERKFTDKLKIHSHSLIFRYGRSIFCLPHRPKFSDFFDLCLHLVSMVRGRCK